MSNPDEEYFDDSAKLKKDSAKINTAMGYLRNSKREILDTTWCANRFLRFRVIKSESSITESIIRTSQGKDFNSENNEFEKFYEDLKEYLKRESEESQEEILYKFLKNKTFTESVKEKNIKIINEKQAKKITDLTFTYKDNPIRGFNIINSVLENLKPNCNLFSYFANSEIKEKQEIFFFPNYRFEEKKIYNEIKENFTALKKEISKKDGTETKKLCDLVKQGINNRYDLDARKYFYKNLFDPTNKEDYPIYLYDLYPYIFKTNFIIMIPWSEDVSVEEIIIRDPTYPFIILFRPFERTNFTYETGAYLASGRKVKYVIHPEKDKNLLASILVSYNSNFAITLKKHYKKFVEFKKENEDTAAERYYEYITRESNKYRYTGQNKDITKFIKELKYYQTDIDDIISSMNM